MKTLYYDPEFKLHTTNPYDAYTAVETDFFDGKCDTFIEGHRIVPAGESWTRSDGFVFRGATMITPWKPHSELAAAQQAYEKQQLAEYEALIDELYAEVTADG